ncbi:spore coat protein [Candidatus Pacearchaeota archaeon]|nr:spore coat protein [Candidatus Pacearchaeota archaeon]|tara:strand:- start:11747 stop:12442 length:696 start_codon:yes stop_codon:yes gene_type:complete
MKGIILAGGTGSRLRPLTSVTNKHLVAVYNKPMIDYPLGTLISMGIGDILIISGREHVGHFIEYLGSGERYNAQLTYRVQEESGGIAQALSLARNFIGQDNMTVILGDNIFEDSFTSTFNGGSRVFLKKVPDPERFGVVRLEGNKITEIIEKPNDPPSDYAVTGLYQYDANVFDIIESLKPSDRGELEITDVNNVYIKIGLMKAEFVRGFWSDAGTFESLAKTTRWLHKTC